MEWYKEKLKIPSVKTDVNKIKQEFLNLALSNVHILWKGLQINAY